jgi:cytochrome c peroxidase
VGVAATGIASSQPKLEPLTGAPPFPLGNPPTEAKIRLGEELFFDSVLSGNRRRSCSTCHKRELHFTDGLSRAWGLDESELSRKTPGLLNVGWQRSIFFDGRVKTLEEQVSKPLENHREMDLDPDEAVDRIRSDPFYVRLFADAFPAKEITFGLVAKAIASFERTLVSYDSDFDRYMLGDEAAMSPSAKRGMELFQTEAECIKCHNGPLFTDHEFHFTGVPERDGHEKRGTKYKTQSLRDSLRRYSYMHNGRMMNIRQVIEHYDGGGSAPDGLEAEIRPLGLAEHEKDDLVAFLRSLNGRVHRFTGSFPGLEENVSGAAPESPVPSGADSGESGAAVDDPSYLNR